MRIPLNTMKNQLEHNPAAGWLREETGGVVCVYLYGKQHG